MNCRKYMAEVAGSLICEHLDTLDDVDDSSYRRRAFLICLWTDHFAEKLSELWLVAMAYYKYVVEGDNFAFGYLVALIDQSRANQE